MSHATRPGPSRTFRGKSPCCSHRRTVLLPTPAHRAVAGSERNRCWNGGCCAWVVMGGLLLPGREPTPITKKATPSACALRATWGPRVSCAYIIPPHAPGIKGPPSITTRSSSRAAGRPLDRVVSGGTHHHDFRSTCACALGHGVRACLLPGAASGRPPMLPSPWSSPAAGTWASSLVGRSA